MNEQYDEWQAIAITIETSRDASYLDDAGQVISAFQKNELVIRVAITEQRYVTPNERETRTRVRLYPHNLALPLPRFLIQGSVVTLNTLEGVLKGIQQ